MKGNKKNAMKKKTKMHVSFDMDARKEYLTGFSKRKQARRRYGLDTEAYKQRKKQLEAKKQLRLERKKLMEKVPDVDTFHAQQKSDDEEEDKSTDEADQNTKTIEYNDEHTKSKFGDSVTVVTTLGIPSDDEAKIDEITEDEDEDDELEASASKTGGAPEKQLTLFQRIQLKRRGLALPSKRAKIKAGRQAMKHFNSFKSKKQLRKEAKKEAEDGGNREGKRKHLQTSGSKKKRRRK